ncbi:MAG: di-heme oxidoredictase family protein, partial [Verrucomicrobiota bacterium]
PPASPAWGVVVLVLLTRSVALLGVGARRGLADAEALAGEVLFGTAGCASCHRPEMTTSEFHPFAELRGQTIRPFTDLLLHDMGGGLADTLGSASAAPSEWRTAPLWNIGLTAGVNGGTEEYLHDGRARSLEEAILWHGGEAEEAKEAFRTMNASERVALIAFLKSLLGGGDGLWGVGLVGRLGLWLWDSLQRRGGRGGGAEVWFLGLVRWIDRIDRRDGIWVVAGGCGAGRLLAVLVGAWDLALVLAWDLAWDLAWAVGRLRRSRSTAGLWGDCI